MQHAEPVSQVEIMNHSQFSLEISEVTHKSFELTGVPYKQTKKMNRVKSAISTMMLVWTMIGQFQLYRYFKDTKVKASSTGQFFYCRNIVQCLWYWTIFLSSIFHLYTRYFHCQLERYFLPFRVGLHSVVHLFFIHLSCYFRACLLEKVRSGQSVWANFG
jgi:hypothetical protein